MNPALRGEFPIKQEENALFQINKSEKERFLCVLPWYIGGMGSILAEIWIWSIPMKKKY